MSVTVRIRPLYNSTTTAPRVLRYAMDAWAVQRCPTCNHLIDCPKQVVEISDMLFDRWVKIENELETLNAELLREMRRLP